ncbi:glucosyltransferase domain-containing protein [Candidatus Altiarchaeota archaeon]
MTHPRAKSLPLLSVDLLHPFKSAYDRLVRPYSSEVLVIILLSFISYGFLGYNHLYAGDDWVWVVESGNISYHFIGIGRWVQVLLFSILSGNAYAPAFTLSILVAGLLLAGIIACDTIGIRSRQGFFMFNSLFIFSPFWIEDFVLKSNHANIGFGVVFASLCARIIWRESESVISGEKTVLKTIPALLVSCILFSLSASCFQTLTPIIAVIFLLAYLNRLIRNIDVKDPRMYGLPFIPLSFVFFLGLMVYSANVHISQGLTGIGSSYEVDYLITSTLISSQGDLYFTINRFMGHFSQFMFKSQHLMPLWIKIVFIIGYIALLGTVFSSIKRSSPVPARVYSGLVILLLLFLIFMTPWLLGLIRMPRITYRYTGLVALSLVHAGLFVIAIEDNKTPLFRSLLQILGFLVIIGFIFQNNIASSVVSTNNVRDLALAQRIIGRIEAHPGYDSFSRQGHLTLLQIGEPAWSEDHPFAAHATDPPMDASVVDFKVYDGLRGMRFPLILLSSEGLQYYVNRYPGLDRVAEPSVRAEARKMKEWPSKESLKVLDDGRVILLFSRGD